MQGISNKLGCDLPTAKRVLESLFEDGLVVVKGNKYAIFIRLQSKMFKLKMKLLLFIEPKDGLSKNR